MIRDAVVPRRESSLLGEYFEMSRVARRQKMPSRTNFSLQAAPGDGNLSRYDSGECFRCRTQHDSENTLCSGPYSMFNGQLNEFRVY